MATRFRKVVVVGLDGLEPEIVEPMLAAGELPNLAAIRGRGGYARLATTAPAQTPVAWSTFATGVNPGGHGIFDFLRRDPETYLPDLALSRHERGHAFSPPRAVNLRKGTPVWEVLGSAGVPSSIIRCPCTYPAGPVHGRLLCGVGVPDLRGGQGTGTFYTTDEGASAGAGERVVPIRPGVDGVIVTTLFGPRVQGDPPGLRLDVTIRPDPAGGGVVLRCPAASPGELTVVPGRWSDWLRVRFKAGFLRSVRGQVRFRLTGGGSVGGLRLYASPIQFDPEDPLFPVSSPAGYAAELAGEIGPFYTAGMVEDHAALINGRIDERAFLEQCAGVWDEREAMMDRELARADEGLVFCLYDTPDRVQHMFWRYREPDHPANRGRPAPAEFSRTIEEHYRRADAAVGAALAFADDRTLTVVLSDHGFGSFRRCVDLNAWLHTQGLLVLEVGMRPGPEAGELFRGVDWGRTRAYAIGLGGIYLNVRGRESRGVVDPAEAATLAAAIAHGLRGLTDPATGVTAVRDVRPREALYRGPYVADAPDLLAFLARGYRVSWGTAMGGVGAEVFSDNIRAWGGDHIVDPALVPGVLFLDKPFRPGAPGLADLAPTILGALGVPAPSEMEGSSLLT